MEQLLARFRAVSLRASQTTCSSCRALSSTASRQASNGRPRRRHVDPYAAAQARSRKAANISRQAELQQARLDGLGDPVRGKATPFTIAFDSASAPPEGSERSEKVKLVNPSKRQAQTAEHLNFSVTSGELDSALEYSKTWSGSSISGAEAYNSMINEQNEQMHQEARPLLTSAQQGIDLVAARHQIATEALKRITSLANASSKERLSVNIKNCVSTFGRHNTDKHLPTKPQPSNSFLASQVAQQGGKLPVSTPRAGPDTGSSEVQIAVLTARIRTLSQFMDSRGKMDKMNKRNLRVLVHRRQKLLKYLQRKERGGPRFQNVVDVLGLTPGAWEGEISL